jgi:tetratricopeptide (TPR) repeat protein
MEMQVSAPHLAEEGKAAYLRSDFLLAAQIYETAAQVYFASQDLLMSAEMANNSCVAFLRAGDPQSAIRIIEGTDQIFADAGDLRRQGMARGNLGSALEALGQLDKAAEAYRQSADLLEKAGEDQLRSNALHALSTIYLRRGHQMLALSTMHSAINGVKHPTLQQRFLKKLLAIPYQMLNRQ